jgi:hypothetical protein
MTTEWFTKKHRPERHGVYQVRFRRWSWTPVEIGYRYWNGERWSCMASTVKKAERIAGEHDFYAHVFEWRGLTREEFMGRTSSIGYQVRDAQKVVSLWSKAKRDSVRLEGQPISHRKI